jgi:bacterioferritin
MSAKSIELLNKAVQDEMAAAHQYMYFHFHCDDQGLNRLAALFRRTAIEEMGHIERIAERILFLKGDVDLKASMPVKPIRDVREMLACARSLEEQSIRDYNAWALECGNGADSASRKVFEDLVADEERHFSQYDNEIDNIERFGDSYLALQSMAPGGGDTPA